MLKSTNIFIDENNFFQYLLGDGPLQWSRTLVAQHHARWLSAIILILKMCIVGLRFLTQAEYKNILDLGFFFTHPFPPFWFLCPILTNAPQLTLDLHHDLLKWGMRDPALSEAVAQKNNSRKSVTWSAVPYAPLFVSLMSAI